MGLDGEVAVVARSYMVPREEASLGLTALVAVAEDVTYMAG